MENKLVLEPNWQKTLIRLDLNEELEHDITDYNEINKIRVRCSRIKKETGREFSTTTLGMAVKIKRVA